MNQVEASEKLLKNRNHLIEIFHEIINLPENIETKQLFLNATSKYKYKSCDTRIGWASGIGINIVCKLDKFGKNECIDTIVDGIEDIAEPLFFILGLNPKIFHFNPQTVIDQEQNMFFMFKFLKNKDGKAAV